MKNLKFYNKNNLKIVVTNFLKHFMKKILSCEKLTFKSFISLTMYYFLKLCLKRLKLVLIFFGCYPKEKLITSLYTLCYVLF